MSHTCQSAYHHLNRHTTPASNSTGPNQGIGDGRHQHRATRSTHPPLPRSNRMRAHLRPWLLLATLLLPAAAQSQPAAPSLLSQLVNGASTASAAAADSTPILPRSAATRDAWAADATLQAAQRLLDGDHLNLLSELVANKDLDTIWAQPWAAHRLLNANPVLQLIPGLGALADKAPAAFTAEDGRAALTAFRGFVRRALENVGKRMDPEDMAADLEAYAKRGEKDAAWQALMDAAGAGDGAAAGKLHDVVFDELWGGVLDKEKLGLGAGGKAVKEAAATARLREHVKTAEPALWKLITQEDPFITQMMEDPLVPLQIVRDLTEGELQASAAAAAATVEAV